MFHALDWQDKQAIVGWGMPDYSAGISPTLVSSTLYNATSNIMINGYFSLKYNSSGKIKIWNSSETLLQTLDFMMGNQNETRYVPFEVVVPKGYKYSFEFGGNTGLVNVKVFPLLGG